jgi:TRAP-type C4-dicarboxylate transport system substrate-binding protein
MYTLINENRYKSLPPDIQKLFDDSRKYFTDNWGKWWQETDAKAIDVAKAAGNKVVDLPDDKRNAWREKMKPVIDKYIEEQSKTVANSREIYDAMVVALKKYE